MSSWFNPTFLRYFSSALNHLSKTLSIVSYNSRPFNYPLHITFNYNVFQLTWIDLDAHRILIFFIIDSMSCFTVTVFLYIIIYTVHPQPLDSSLCKHFPLHLHSFSFASHSKVFTYTKIISFNYLCYNIQFSLSWDHFNNKQCLSFTACFH